MKPSKLNPKAAPFLEDGVPKGSPRDGKDMEDLGGQQVAIHTTKKAAASAGAAVVRWALEEVEESEVGGISREEEEVEPAKASQEEGGAEAPEVRDDQCSEC